MDDKLIRLARKVKTLEDELSHLSQIKDLEGLLVASNDMNSRYKKSINETVGMYKEYISNTKKELTDSFEAIKKDYDSKKDSYKKNMNNLEAKINKVKDDIQKVCTSIDKSIEDIQKDILKDIKDKNTQILNEIGKKDKELKEVKQENVGLVKDLKALKDLVGKLELQKGDDGKSAYDIACELGFKGTKEEWIKSLHGKDGQDIELRGLRAFSDVKNDNKMYARKNKKWVEVENYDDTEIREDIEELQEENETHAEQIEALQTENTRLKATLPTTTDEGENITLSKTAELEFIQPPLPRGNSEQVQYSGKNKLPNALQSGTSNGVNYTINQDKSITLNGTNTSSSAVWIKLADNFTLSAGTYTMSNGNDNASTTTALFADDGANFGRVNKQTKTFETDITVKPYLYIGGSATFNNFTIFPMIEEGSTATDYEPYVGGQASPNPSYPQAISNVTGDVEVLVQNKNLLRTDINYVSTYHDTKAYLDLYIILGTASTLNAKFVYQGRVDNTGRIYARFTTTDDYTRFTIKHNGSSNDLSKTYNFNFKNGVEYIISINLTGVNPTVDGGFSYNDVMITTGNADYVEHKEQTYTFPLGTQRMYLGDYLADDGIHHVRGVMTFDGSENWYDYTPTYEGYYTGYTSKHFGRSGNFEEDILCNYFENLGLGSPNPTLKGTMYATYIKVPNSIATNMTELKIWLGTHNVEVEYPLATETVEAYTTEQQQVYNQIKQAISYEEQTNISGSSDESNPIFSVEAYQSIKLILAS